MYQPIISIIIPCYNHGKYVLECIESIRELKNIQYEIILINDGSTDDGYTEKIINSISIGEITKIHQENQGLSKTRNNAIKLSKGKYILPLDSDNKITNNFVSNAINLLENDNSIDIVYCNRKLFFENGKTKIKYPGKFSIIRLLYSNYIDACAIYRKDVWKKLDGYDENMKQGLEDWEFWIRCCGENLKFYYLQNSFFYYRVLNNSMVRGTLKKYEEINEYIIKKNANIFATHLKKNAFEYSYRERKPILYIIRKLFTPKYFSNK